MSINRDDIEKIEREVEANRGDLTASRDTAVFYTTGANAQAVAYAREHGSVTLEGVRHRSDLVANEQIGEHGTPFGATIEKRGYYRPTTGNIGVEEAEQNLKNADAAFLCTSRVYAEQASGDVEVFIGPPPEIVNGTELKQAPFIVDDSVFAQVEREALIRNPAVTTINGQNRQDLCMILDTEKPLKNALAKIDAQLIDGHLSREKRLLAKVEKKETPLEFKMRANKQLNELKSKSR